MRGRTAALMLGLIVAAATVASGCFLRRGRLIVPRIRVRGPAVRVGVRPPVRVYTTPVVRVAPPARRGVVARSCPVGYYWYKGRYRWYAGRYLWVAGRCAPIPVQYRRRRCRYYVGRWVRTAGGWRRYKGYWRCH